MNQLIKWIPILLPGILLFMSIQQEAWAQAGSTKVSVKVVAYYKGEDSEGTGWNEYRWKFWYNGSTNSICVKRHAKNPGWGYEHYTIVEGINHNKIPGYNGDNPSLYITMESWEEDKGDDCSYNSKDDAHYGPNSTVAVYNLYNEQPPGTTTQSIMRKAFIYNSNNKVTYEFFYTPPQPLEPSIDGNPTVVCVNDVITLNTDTYVHPSFHDQVQLHWEYWIVGEYEAITGLPRWRSMGSYTTASVNNGEKTVSVEDLAGLENLSERKEVHFRVRSWANDTYGNYSTVTSIEVDPLGPNFSISSTKASCSAVSDGEITLTVASGTGKYRYLIKKSGSPDEFTGTFSGSSKTISGREPGTYIIRLSNYRDNAAFLSACDITRTATVGTVSAIQWNSSTKAYNPSCPDGKGRIYVDVDRGSSAHLVNFSITGGHAFTRTGSKYDQGNFYDLPAGSYTVTATDPCNNTVLTKSFVITAPPKIIATVSTTDLECNNPNDGKIKVTVSSGPGKYDYELWKGTSLVTAKNNITAASYTFSNLPSGTNYKIRVYDATRKSCPPFEQTGISLSFTPLAFSSLTKSDICCAGETGSVKATPIGGSGSYEYTLVHSSGSYTQTNTTGSFTVNRGGTYTVTVKNSSSACSDAVSRSISIVEPDPLSATIHQKNITCSGVYNGQLTATVSGGSSPYTYQWQERESKSEPWYNYSGQGAGTNKISQLYDARYRLIITDKNGCQLTTKEYILTDPEELSFDEVNIQHIGCKGANDGRIIPKVSGGWGNYLFEYRKESQTGYTSFTDQTSLASGTYYIRVIDQESCIVTYPDPLIITEPDEALTLGPTVSDYGGYQVSCFDGKDGWIEAMATGGNGTPFSNQYQFALDDGAFTLQPRFSGLTASTYQLHLKDERGCIVTQSITLASPDELRLSTSDKNYIQCFGDSTGYITLQANGGVTPYSYRIGASDWQENPTFEHLPADNYTLTVKDVQGCETTLVESITTNDPLSITFNKTDVRCYEEDNGVIDAAISGGKAPYALYWQEIASTEAKIDNLSPGWYTLTITDTDSCSLTDSIQVQEPEAELLTTPIVTPVRCFGEDNGQIALSATGGTLPYRYSIDGGTTFQNDSVFINLAPGTYTTLTEDSKGCSFTIEATVTQPDPLELSLESKTDILCHGDTTGAISIQTTGGTQPYQYSLDGKNWQDVPDFADLAAGEYQVQVQDKHGCTSTLTVTLVEPEAYLQLTYQTTPVQCKGTATGNITTTVIGGTAPYNYQWGGLTTNTATVNALTQGDYISTITDNHGCQVIDTITVTEPEIALQGSTTEQRNVSCFGLSNGFVQVEAKGGYLPYEYAWQGNTFSDVFAYDNLSAGEYQMVIRDSMNCEAVVDIYISQPDLLEASAEAVQHVSCFGGNDAQFRTQVTGGTQPYRYSLDNGITWQSEALFSGYPTGHYAILVEDTLGCQASTELDITEPTPLTAFIENIVDAACNQANGEAQIFTQGGTLPYRYEWVNRLDELLSEEAHPNNLRAGIYDVYVTDTNNCQVHLTQIINNLDGPTSQISEWQNATCFTSADGSATVEAEGGTKPYHYLWDDSHAQTTPAATNLTRENYFAKVTDQRGCVSISPVTIGSPDAFQIDTLQWQAPSCYEACDGQLEITVSGGIAPYTYQWEGRSETAPTLVNLCRGEYTLTVTDAAGCTFTQVFDMVPPPPLQLTVISDTSPTCFQGCDGQTAITVQGGTAPYLHQWDDAKKQTNSQADSLCAGTYTISVTDSQGCQAEQSVVIEETPQIAVSLPDTVTLCLDQTAILDASIPFGNYEWWHNGSPYGTSSSIMVDQAGAYQVTVTNERGCREVALTQVLSYDTLFEVNFLQATELYVGDTLTLTEVCYPQPDSLHWTYPPGVSMFTSSPWEPQITFEEAGSYEITLTGYYSVCTDSVTKTVAFFPPLEDLPSNGRIVQGPKGIKTVALYPNPTNGYFQVEVTLYSATPLFAFVNDASGQEVDRIQQKGSDTYSFDFDIGHHASGQYVLRLVTQYDKKIARILLR